jgi:hypothetical protein
MVMIFFYMNGITYMLDILPEGVNMNSGYLVEHVNVEPDQSRETDEKLHDQ